MYKLVKKMYKEKHKVEKELEKLTREVPNKLDEKYELGDKQMSKEN